MPFTPQDIYSNRDYFTQKLRAEKQVIEVLQRVQKGSGDFVVLDVRARDAYRKAHVPGALSVPLADLGALLPQLPKEKELVTYCYNAH